MLNEPHCWRPGRSERTALHNIDVIGDYNTIPTKESEDVLDRRYLTLLIIVAIERL